ncbi:MAG: hypothetical protein ITF98_03175 [Fermentimonas sp.]|nr:hypothetical protein [Fermentimonas sp.]
MARLKTGINGDLTGKVGTVVGAKWRDIYYIRSLPTKKNNPRTKGQVRQRSKLSVTMEFLKSITPYIRIGYKEYSTGRLTAFNAATSYNIKNATTENNNKIELDFSKVLVTRGSLITAPDIKSEIVNGQLHFSWDTALKENARSNDLVMLLAYSQTKKEAIYNICVAQRSHSTAQMRLPSAWHEDIIHSYISFRSADGELVSDSITISHHFFVILKTFKKFDFKD